MKVVFLLTHVPNPRINKRIAALKKVAEVQVICTRRKSQNLWDPEQDVEHIIFDIDLPSAKHLIKRLIVSKNYQREATECLKRCNPDFIYAEGFDSLIIAHNYKKNHPIKIIYEVSDLRDNYIEEPSNLAQKFLNNILLNKEKDLIKSISLLIVTSPKFYDIHYKELIPKNKVLFVPNMPDINVFESFERKKIGVFTVGFIGGIRYIKQMKMLVDVANLVKCNVIFAGIGFNSDEYEEIKKYARGMTNIIFSGKYNYREEIASIYGCVDCVFAVYDADNANVRIALPNKLYEAVWCEIPIIVAKQTYLAELVEKWGVGCSVDHRLKDDLVVALNRFMDDADYYNKIVQACKTEKYKLLQNNWEKNLINFLK